jgi:hypothetical protein
MVVIACINIESIVPRTCDDLKKLGVTKSGSYLIDPDGPGVGDPPFTAECDMDGPTGKAVQY